MSVYLISSAVSWAYVAVFYFLGGSVTNLFYPLFCLTLMWIPGIFALIAAKKEKITLPVFAPVNRYFGLAALTPLLIGLLVTIFSLPVAEERSFQEMESTLYSLRPLHYQIPSPDTLLGVFLVFFSALIAMSMYTFAALGEELLWRGLLWEKMKHFGFWTASFIIGLGWGIWHWPVICMGHNYPGYPFSGNVLMITFAILASPLATYFRVMSRSILGAAIFHGFMNIAGTASYIIFIDPNELLVDLEGLAGIIALIFFNIGLYISTFYKVKA